MPSSTVEDYLKAILHLEESDRRSLTVGEIAAELQVTPGTVSSMLRHLRDEGWVDYIPRRSVTLLPTGRQQALRVIRRHRLIESFLVSVMKLDWSEVHDEAEILEHVVSDRLLSRMDEMLGFPDFDPHGAPIPTDAGERNESPSLPLSEAEPGSYTIAHVGESDAQLLHWLREQGLIPGCDVEMAGKDGIVGIIELHRLPLRQKVLISEKVAEQIFLRPSRLTTPL
ncbi:MAG: metal-dependent transcriptional regulator [Verrucomicrobiota bacterium]